MMAILDFISEPSLVGALKLIELKFLFELSDVVLGNLDLTLRILVQLLDLVGRNLGKFILDLLSLHLVDLHLLNDEGRNINLFITCFAHRSLFSQSVLQDL